MISNRTVLLGIVSLNHSVELFEVGRLCLEIRDVFVFTHFRGIDPLCLPPSFLRFDHSRKSFGFQGMPPVSDRSLRGDRIDEELWKRKMPEDVLVVPSLSVELQSFHLALLREGSVFRTAIFHISISLQEFDLFRGVHLVAHIWWIN